MARYDFEAVITDQFNCKNHRPYSNISADSEREAKEIAREKAERDYPNAIKIEIKKR